MLTGWETKECTEITPVLPIIRQKFLRHFKVCECIYIYIYTWSDNEVRKLDIRGIVHYEFVPTGQTVNEVYYLEVLKRLHEKVRRKQPKLFASNSWILHQDNTPAHMALSVREFLATKQIAVLEHPAYSPDLAPQ